MKKWVIDVSDWKVYDFASWHQAVTNLDIETMTDFMSRIIIQCPYMDDPRVKTNYQWLGIAEFVDCCNHIADAILMFMQGKSTIYQKEE